MHFQYVCQPATQSTTPQEWKVKDLEWYRAYREVVFKQLEDAAEEGATGLDAAQQRLLKARRFCVQRITQKMVQKFCS